MTNTTETTTNDSTPSPRPLTRDSRLFPRVGVPIDIALQQVTKRRKFLAHQVEQATTLMKQALAEPDEREIPVRPEEQEVGAVGGLSVGLDDTPTLSGVKITYNATSHGGTAAQYLAEGGCWLILGPNRRKERDLVARLRPNDLVLAADSSKAVGGATVSGVGLFHSSAVDSEDDLWVFCVPLVRFETPLPSASDRRPQRLRGGKTAFGGSFSAQPLITPLTASDLLGLQEAFGWSDQVLAADLGTRLDGLHAWAHALDHGEVAQRWRAQAGPDGSSPRRVVLGGACGFIGATGEIIVEDLLSTSLPQHEIVDVSRSGATGCDRLVRDRHGRDVLKVEVKATTEAVADPVRWLRRKANFTPWQRKVAAQSLERGGVPWLVAAVTDVLASPQVTFVSPLEIFSDLAHRLDLRREAA